MAKNRTKEHSMDAPIEKHSTAAWADIEEQKRVSGVPIPNETSVKNAKEWVDTNEK